MLTLIRFPSLRGTAQSARTVGVFSVIGLSLLYRIGQCPSTFGYLYITYNFPVAINKTKTVGCTTFWYNLDRTPAVSQ